MSDDGDDSRYRRVGNPSECPTCGWRMNPNAYYCLKCRNYHCFKCRTRMAVQERQYQCADQSCPQYGKLLCPTCTIMVPVFQDVKRTEYDTVPDKEESKEPRWGCVVSTLVFGIVPAVGFGIYASSWFAGCGICLLWGLPVTVVLAVFQTVHQATTKQVAREVIENKQVAEHRCCIQCRHPCKVLR